jgi:hypothetical protein
MNSNADMLAHATSVANALSLCAQHMQIRDVRERFAELGERLAGLVAIGKEPGGVEIVAAPIEDTMHEVDQMLDGLIRMGKH